ncbi:Phosphoinositide-3-kinase, regulatory subunit 3a (gamma) [Balamuthia mandrillaris]
MEERIVPPAAASERDEVVLKMDLCISVNRQLIRFLMDYPSPGDVREFQVGLMSIQEKLLKAKKLKDELPQLPLKEETMVSLDRIQNNLEHLFIKMAKLSEKNVLLRALASVHLRRNLDLKHGELQREIGKLLLRLVRNQEIKQLLREKGRGPRKREDGENAVSSSSASSLPSQGISTTDRASDSTSSRARERSGSWKKADAPCNANASLDRPFVNLEIPLDQLHQEPEEGYEQVQYAVLGAAVGDRSEPSSSTSSSVLSSSAPSVAQRRPVQQFESLPELLSAPPSSSLPTTTEHDTDGRHFWNTVFREQFFVEWDVFETEFCRWLRLPPLKHDERKVLQYIMDSSGTGGVTVAKFEEFLSGWGPLCDAIANVKRWFHGFLSREETQQLLEGEPPGTFLVRLSASRPASFALSVVKPSSSSSKENAWEVLSVLVQPDGHYGVRAQVKDAEYEKFANIRQVVKRYPQAFRIAFQAEFVGESWFHGDVTSQEAEDLLAGQAAGTFLIRFSTRRPHFASSYVLEDGSVGHGLIEKNMRPNGKPVSFEHEGRSYASLQAVVKAYPQTLRVPYCNPRSEMYAIAANFREEKKQEMQRQLAQQLASSREKVGPPSSAFSSASCKSGQQHYGFLSDVLSAPTTTIRTKEGENEKEKEEEEEEPYMYAGMGGEGAKNAELTREIYGNMAELLGAPSPCSTSSVVFGETSYGSHYGTMAATRGGEVPSTFSKSALEEQQHYGSMWPASNELSGRTERTAEDTAQQYGRMK